MLYYIVLISFFLCGCKCFSCVLLHVAFVHNPFFFCPLSFLVFHLLIQTRVSQHSCSGRCKNAKFVFLFLHLLCLISAFSSTGLELLKVKWLECWDITVVKVKVPKCVLRWQPKCLPEYFYVCGCLCVFPSWSKHSGVMACVGAIKTVDDSVDVCVQQSSTSEQTERGLSYFQI